MSEQPTILNTRSGQSDRRIWRSILFVPVIIQKFVDKCHTYGADVIVLDLEDSVPVEQKQHARERVAGIAALARRGGADILVRVNAPWRMLSRDLEALVCEDVTGILLPKARNAAHIETVGQWLDEIESERGLAHGMTKIVPLIETVDAYFSMLDIARASDRVVALAMGTEDFAASAEMGVDRDCFAVPKQQMILAARAAGVLPLGYAGTIANLGSPEEVEREARYSYKLGSVGAMTVHPKFVPVLNQAFSPTHAEVQWASEVLVRYDNGLRQGRGATSNGSGMVDAPVAQRALNLLELHRTIRQRFHRE